MPQGRSADEPAVSYSLFQVSRWVTQVLRSADDLTRITYEAFEAAHRTSATRHLEVSFDAVPEHLASLGYLGSVEAYAEGIRLAERDFGMTGRLIAAIDRSGSGEDALERVRTVVDQPHEYVAGIGLDNLETAGPPERFAAAYRLAGEAGLGRTAHSSEHAPVAVNTVTCLDALGCDRIDHGYFVLQDDDVVARVRDEQVPFTVISTTSRRSWRPWRRASIAAMLEAGLNVIPASDDPGCSPRRWPTSTGSSPTTSLSRANGCARWRLPGSRRRGSRRRRERPCAPVRGGAGRAGGCSRASRVRAGRTGPADHPQNPVPGAGGRLVWLYVHAYVRPVCRARPCARPCARPSAHPDRRARRRPGPLPVPTRAA